MVTLRDFPFCRLFLLGDFLFSAIDTADGRIPAPVQMVNICRISYFSSAAGFLLSTLRGLDTHSLRILLSDWITIYHHTPYKLGTLKKKNMSGSFYGFYHDINHHTKSPPFGNDFFLELFPSKS